MASMGLPTPRRFTITTPGIQSDADFSTDALWRGYKRCCGFGSKPFFFRAHQTEWRVEARRAAVENDSSCFFRAVLEVCSQDQFDALWRRVTRLRIGGTRAKVDPVEAKEMLSASGMELSLMCLVPCGDNYKSMKPWYLEMDVARNCGLVLLLHRDDGVFDPHWAPFTTVTCTSGSWVTALPTELDWFRENASLMADTLLQVPAYLQAEFATIAADSPEPVVPIKDRAVGKTAASEAPAFESVAKLATDKSRDWSCDLKSHIFSCGVNAPPFSTHDVGASFERRFFYVGRGDAPSANAHVEIGFPSYFSRLLGNSCRSGWLWELHPEVLRHAFLRPGHGVYVRMDTENVKDRRFLANGAYNPAWFGEVQAKGVTFRLVDPVCVRWATAVYTVYRLQIVRETILGAIPYAPLEESFVTAIRLREVPLAMPDLQSLPNRKAFLKVTFQWLARCAEDEMVASINLLRDQTLSILEEGKLAEDFDPCAAAAAAVQIARSVRAQSGVQAGAYSCA